MPPFVDPTTEEKRSALAELSDADLIGRYWRLEDLTALTTDERHRLQAYRYETFGYEDYCEKAVGHRPRRATDVAGLAAVLDRWECAFYNLRLWNLNRTSIDAARNPISKVLIFEESRITGVRARLEVGTAPLATPPLIPPGPKARTTTDPDPSPPARPMSAGPSAAQPSDPDGIRAITALAESVADLAAAINKLTDSVSRR